MEERLPSQSDEIVADLEFLYGPASAAELAGRLDALVSASAERLKSLSGKPRLDQRDVLLITYGDQVREAGFLPLQVLKDFCEAHLRGVIGGIHLLPFYPYTSDDGFSVTDYFAVDPKLGTWEQIGGLGRSFDLMFDAVFNHLSAQGAWFKGFLAGDPAFAGFFVSVEGEPDLSQVVRPRALPLLTEFRSDRGPVRVWTTFSEDQVDLNVANPEVLLRLIEVLLFYVGRGARFVRLDAIAYLWKSIGTPCIHLPQTHRVIRLLRAVLDRTAPHVALITETNVPHRENVSYFGDGKNEAQLVYNFALPPLVLHSLATGDGTRLTEWAGGLQTPSDRTAFFNFLASHDGIGLNPARGLLSQGEIDALVDRTVAHGGLVSYKFNPDGSRSPYELNINYFDALSDPSGDESEEVQIARFICAHSIQIALAGMPGIYFHSLFGSRGDRAAVEASGIPRRINREKLLRPVLELELADPSSLRSRVFAAMRRFLRIRRAHPAFAPGASQEILSLHPGVFAVRRGERVVCLSHLRETEVRIDLPRAGPGCRDLIGDSRVEFSPGRIAVTLRPYQVVWLDLA